MSTSSTSVTTPARRQSREKKTVAIMWDSARFHHIQLPEMPSLATMPVTARGVSAAKVVATIDVPAIHQGSVRPDRKYSAISLPARRWK